MKTVAVLSCCAALASPLYAGEPFFQKGVNFTAEGPVGYSPEAAVGMLDQLRNHGVKAIALVTYGFCSKREPVIRFCGGWERGETIGAVTELAHKLGSKGVVELQLWLHCSITG